MVEIQWVHTCPILIWSGMDGTRQIINGYHVVRVGNVEVPYILNIWVPLVLRRGVLT